MSVENVARDLARVIIDNSVRPSDNSGMKPTYFNRSRNKILFLKKEDAIEAYKECSMKEVFTGYWTNDRQGFYNKYAKNFIFFDSVKNFDVDDCTKTEVRWNVKERGRLVGDLVCFMDNGDFKVYEVQGFYIKYNANPSKQEYRYPIIYGTRKWWE